MKQSIILQTPDGFDLDTDYYPGTNEKGIVFIHGIANDRHKEEYFVKAAEILHKKGFSALLLDLRAHGKSTGDSVEDFTISSQLTDIDVAVQFLRDEGCKTIYLAGASFGGGATVLYTIQHPEITKLLLSNPSLDYDRTIVKHFAPQLHLLETQGYIEAGSKKFKLGKKLFDELQQFTPYKELEKYKGDLLIIHGDKDTRIAHQGVIEIFEKLSNPRKKFTLIYGADHGFHDEPYTTQAAENIVQFFTS